jgi:lysophospholipid acyltransferase (LPLAT)-like uncharacterized protein
MPFERMRRFRLPKGYPGVYPPPPHVSLEERSQAIRELRAKPGDNKTFKKKVLVRVAPFILKWSVEWIYRLSRQKLYIHPETQKLIADPKGQFITAIWHNRLFYAVYSLRYRQAQYGHDVLAIISDSSDGEIIARTTEHWGAFTARGSSTRGGKKAMKRLLKYVRLHFHPLITPDGPLGPVYEVKEGVVALAKLTGLPIVPVAYDTPSKWVFSSWDGFMVPKPFARVHLDYGKPIYIERDMSTEEGIALVQQAMMDQVNELARRAEQYGK